MTLIRPDAVMVGLLLVWIRRADCLGPRGWLVALMVASFAVRVAEVPMVAIPPVVLARLTALPPGLLTMTPGLRITVNKSGGGVVGPPKLMLVLKVPVPVVLGWAALSVPGLATGVKVCATAGSDKASDARIQAATSQNFRRFVAMPGWMVGSRR